MEKITTRRELLDHIKNVRGLEVIAKKSYESDILTFKNFEITQKVEKIKDDEENHIKLLDELISMLERPYKSL